MNPTDFEISSKLEILSILKSMSKSNQLIHMSIPGEKRRALTTILSIEEELDAVILDRARESEFNDLAFIKKQIHLDGNLNNIKIEFDCNSLSQCSIDGHEALMVSLPNTITRLQRREFFRVTTPSANPVRCKIQCSVTGKTEIVALAIKNVSAGGALLVDDQLKLSTEAGTVFRNCEILIPGSTSIIIDMQVKNSLSFLLPNGTAANKLGLEFIKIEPKSKSILQRYINKLELAHKAIKSN